MDISVDQEKCIGCGACEKICPSVFNIDEVIGKSIVIDPDACDFAGCCEAAEENCPEHAIIIR
jgi:ferredoxin